ncbi:hypothetical protein BDV09DRAFT_6963 [Aspergillus tetrazonus]
MKMTGFARSALVSRASALLRYCLAWLIISVGTKNRFGKCVACYGVRPRFGIGSKLRSELYGLLLGPMLQAPRTPSRPSPGQPDIQTSTRCPATKLDVSESTDGELPENSPANDPRDVLLVRTSNTLRVLRKSYRSIAANTPPSSPSYRSHRTLHRVCTLGHTLN